MGGRLISVRVGDVELLVETVPVAGSEQTSVTDKAAGHVEHAFGRAQEAIVEIASCTVQMIERTAVRTARPDHLAVEFGLSFSAQGNVIVAGGATLTYDARPAAVVDADDQSLSAEPHARVVDRR
jgi:hypothetical protein